MFFFIAHVTSLKNSSFGSSFACQQKTSNQPPSRWDQNQSANPKRLDPREGTTNTKKTSPSSHPWDHCITYLYMKTYKKLNDSMGSVHIHTSSSHGSVMGLAVAHFCWQRMQLDERLDMFFNHWSDPFQNGKKTTDLKVTNPMGSMYYLHLVDLYGKCR